MANSSAAPVHPSTAAVPERRAHLENEVEGRKRSRSSGASEVGVAFVHTPTAGVRPQVVDDPRMSPAPTRDFDEPASSPRGGPSGPPRAAKSACSDGEEALREPRSPPHHKRVASGGGSVPWNSQVAAAAAAAAAVAGPSLLGDPNLLQAVLSFFVGTEMVDEDSVRACLRVCTQWRAIAAGRSLWQHLPWERSGSGTINWGRFENLGVRSEGTEGTCHECRDRVTGQLYALKKARVYPKGEGVPYYMLRELAVLRRMNHPHVAALRAVNLRQHRLRLFFDFLPLTLHDFLNPHGADRADGGVPLPPRHVRRLLHQLLEAVAHCHGRGVIHRNLKPKHLLMRPGPSAADPLEGAALQLSDFALVRLTGCLPRTYTSEVVTLWYRPPEILMGLRNYGPSVDIWSVGCIFAEMCHGHALFTGLSEIDQLFQIYHRLATPTAETWPGFTELPHYSQAFPDWERRHPSRVFPKLGAGDAGLDLLMRMLAYDPRRRITAREALRHPYFAIRDDDGVGGVGGVGGSAVGVSAAAGVAAGIAMPPVRQLTAGVAGTAAAAIAPSAAAAAAESAVAAARNGKKCDDGAGAEAAEERMERYGASSLALEAREAAAAVANMTVAPADGLALDALLTATAAEQVGAGAAGSAAAATAASALAEPALAMPLAEVGEAYGADEHVMLFWQHLCEAEDAAWADSDNEAADAAAGTAAIMVTTASRRATMTAAGASSSAIGGTVSKNRNCSCGGGSSSRTGAGAATGGALFVLLGRPRPRRLAREHADMRLTLVNWLLEIVDLYGMCERTAFLAVAFVDGHQSRETTPRERLQLLGATCLHIASKCEDVSYIGIDDLATVAGGVYRPQDILDTEEEVLNALGFDLAVATVFDFVTTALALLPAVGAAAGGRGGALALYLAELSLHCADLAATRPSVVAAACVARALWLLGLPPWQAAVAKVFAAAV
ncbi:unnamed protein product, partial [Phaeothamnion confervicola]